jgi:hypothetical protein
MFRSFFTTNNSISFFAIRSVVPSSALILIGAVACSKSAGSAAEEYFDAVLAYGERCHTQIGFDQDVNRDDLRRSAEANLSADGVTVTASQFSDCATAIADVPCDSELKLDCGLNSPGTLADGTACLENNQCASGYCKEKDLCGTCTSVVPEGGKCDPVGGTRCAKDLRCSVPAGEPQTEAKCEREVFAKAGEACSDSFNSEGPRKGCDKELSCVEGKCTANLKLGAACEQSSGKARCGGVTICLDGTCRLRRLVGESCQSPFDCKTARCEEGKCVERALAAAKAGEKCGGLNGTCEKGTKCMQFTSTDSRCTVPANEGEACYDGPPKEGQTLPRCKQYFSCKDAKCVLTDPALCK